MSVWALDGERVRGSRVEALTLLTSGQSEEPRLCQASTLPSDHWEAPPILVSWDLQGLDHQKKK